MTYEEASCCLFEIFLANSKAWGQRGHLYGNVTGNGLGGSGCWVGQGLKESPGLGEWTVWARLMETPLWHHLLVLWEESSEINFGCLSHWTHCSLLWQFELRQPVTRSKKRNPWLEGHQDSIYSHLKLEIHHYRLRRGLVLEAQRLLFSSSLFVGL